MLRGTSTLRLTRRELARWTKITGFTPANVRSEADLARFALRCKRHFWGTSEDTRFVHFLIDEELERNLSGLPIDTSGVTSRVTSGVHPGWSTHVEARRD
ncbi:MAG: hypothetical protein AB1430_13090 [Pseudomonadota bacterium]